MATPKPLRRLFIPAVVLLIVLGALVRTRFQGRRANSAAPPVATASVPALTSSPSVNPLPEPPVSLAPRIPTPLPRTGAQSPSADSVLQAKQAAFAPPDKEAMIEVDKVNLMIRDYRSIAGENPVGTNAEIMAAVMGDNPRQAKLGPPEGMKLNEKGELIDRWGTPYFFHQISRDHMEIRSAGPDKILWTEDDPVIR